MTRHLPAVPAFFRVVTPILRPVTHCRRIFTAPRGKFTYFWRHFRHSRLQFWDFWRNFTHPRSGFITSGGNFMDLWVNFTPRRINFIHFWRIFIPSRRISNRFYPVETASRIGVADFWRTATGSTVAAIAEGQTGDSPKKKNPSSIGSSGLKMERINPDAATTSRIRRSADACSVSPRRSR